MGCVRNPHMVRHAGRRGPSVDVDLIRALSDQARTTRRPGQTLQSRLNELRREIGGFEEAIAG